MGDEQPLLPVDRLPRWFVPVFIVLLGVFLVVVYVNDWNLWDGARTVEVTDDAYVRGEVRPLSTKVAGVVVLVPVTDYQRVKTGDLIAQLRNDDFQARVDAAAAALRESETALAELKTEEHVQDSRISAAQSSARVGSTNINVSSNNINSADSAINAATAAVKETNSSLVAIDASIAADKADLERTRLERDRQHSLYEDRATTKRGVEQIDAEFADATQKLARDEAQKKALQQQLLARTAELHKAHDDYSNTVDGHSNARNESARLQSVVGEQVGQKAVLVSREAVLEAQVNQRRAALEEAKVALDYTYVRAPADGMISERKVFPGQLVSAGTQVATLVSSTPWVVASYREIQLSHVYVGNQAEITVDGIPGRKFKGTVAAISPASEAQFALLPPDNASGNFTKIAQRIPVKITFDPKEPDLDRMRPGMSVIAHVWTKRNP